jgi:hypothetical protein
MIGTGRERRFAAHFLGKTRWPLRGCTAGGHDDAIETQTSVLASLGETPPMLMRGLFCCGNLLKSYTFPPVYLEPNEAE